MKSHHVPFLDGHFPVCTGLYNKHANACLYLKRALCRTLGISDRQTSGTEQGWAHKNPNFCRLPKPQGLVPIPRFSPTFPFPAFPGDKLCPGCLSEEGPPAHSLLTPQCVSHWDFPESFFRPTCCLFGELHWTYKPVLLEKGTQASLSTWSHWAVCLLSAEEKMPAWRNNLPEWHLKRNWVNPLN